MTEIARPTSVPEIMKTLENPYREPREKKGPNRDRFNEGVAHVRSLAKLIADRNRKWNQRHGLIPKKFSVGHKETMGLGFDKTLSPHDEQMQSAYLRIEMEDQRRVQAYNAIMGLTF